jgi:hypothetical protein
MCLATGDIFEEIMALKISKFNAIQEALKAKEGEPH